MKPKLLLSRQNTIRSFLSPLLRRLLIILALCPAPCALRQASAQTPQGFNYQAIARDGSGNPIVGAAIKVKLSILTDTAGFRATGGGVYLWEEEHLNVSTNAYGLFTIVLGGPGATQCGGSAASFSLINWSLPDLYIGTKIANPTTYKFLGAAKLWSVPYALRAKDTDQWQVNGANIYRPAGNFGIGTNSPVALLDIKTSSNFHFGAFNNTAGAASIGAFNDGFSAWQPLSINPGGQVWFLGGLIGIGTTSPTRKVEIGGTSSSFYLNSATSNLIEYNVQGVAAPSLTTRSVGTKIAIYPSVSATSTDFAFGIESGALWYSVPNANSAYSHRFYAGTTELMRIRGDGNVGIGTVTPGQKLTVAGSFSATTSSFTSMEIGGPAPSPTNGQATFYLHHHSNIAHQLRYASGRLVLEAAGNGYGTNATPEFQVNGSLFAAINGGNVGIGTTTPTSKMTINPPATWDDNVPLFEVKNKYGTPVLAVYNNGVRILVAHDAAKGVTKGGFAIGGFDNTKAMGETVNLMTVAPDSIRFNIDNDNTKGITKGGFAIGSFDVTKGINVNPKEFMNMTPLGSTTGQYNTFLGYQAGSKNKTGIENTFIGYLAGYNLTDPRFTVAIGKEAASQTSLITGFDIPHQGVFIGTGAGKNGGGGYNVMVGNYAGENNHGGFNVFLGQQAGQYSTSMNSVFIGTLAGANETADNKLIIAGDLGNCKLITGNFGAGGSSYVVIAGTDPNSRTFFVNGSAGGWSAWANLSDIRYKKDIVTIPDALSKINQMRGVNFNWKDSLSLEKDKQIGFIAQEVEKILPEVVSKDANSGKLFLEYAPITALLVEAMKEQQLQIENQQKQIESTKEENQLLKSQLQSLQEKMDRIEAMLVKGGVK